MSHNMLAKMIFGYQNHAVMNFLSFFQKYSEQISLTKNTFLFCLHDTDRLNVLTSFGMLDSNWLDLCWNEFLIEDLVCFSQNTLTKESAY